MSVNEHRTPQEEVDFQILNSPDDKDPGNRTFIFGNEDHTLGNALRHVLMQRRETQFCGYSIPHPSEPKMNLRLQTVNKDTDAVDLLKTGLKDLSEICDVVDETFDDALAKFKAK
uniref:DNA-directed RNA polymerase RBP11-like dimerisation domain-containing protein n=1 Tax=Phaeomonas parva TaxID=124430 RepID=A0A7S1TTH9_9STRA|mmetsp:Transcript_17190/g.52782  ORF Transcript_17190/g.52782 Transcript_17190/m.52782 type:complete len:115 (+) Transcript_17190:216-560(+)|eukprot:CAMPEP_0118874706 /NCGR_PEP_ID=MMETSP1163-20130328/16045_1 /TAXON_ID=124430 /ORGANISM="Phaeomonas parva, Strain CCMP2877" /LENGTH=114 /DNA_ID=CAMNT_0006810115 /DNA_START=193 /DNA_END=537 /DNA_ORIENTATION=-